MATRPLPDLAAVRAALVELGYSTTDGVATLQRESNLSPTGVLDRSTIIIILDLQEARQIGERCGHRGPNRAAKGAISSSSGEPAPGLTVQLVESKFRDETVLAAAKTNTSGIYELAFGRAETKDPLFVRVLDGTITVAASPPEVTASALLSIDLVVDAVHVHAPTEYERLRADVLAKIGNVDLTTLREDDQSHDVTFLATSTGWSSDQLVMLIVAARLGALSQVDAGTFYALLRKGVVLGSSRLGARFDINLATLVQPLFYDVVLLDTATIRTAVTSAVADRVVPTSVATNLETTLATFAKSTAAAQAHYQTTQPQQILATVSANVAAGTHTQVIQILQGGGQGDPGQLLSNLQTVQFASGDPTSAASTTLASVLASEPELVSTLQSLANGTPVDRTPSSATNVFAAQLAATKPTVTAHATLLTILKANPTLDLASANLDGLISQHAGPNTSATDAAKLRQQIKAAQRIYKLAPTYPQTTALLDAGVHSAAQISAMGQTQFVTRFTKNGTFSADEARSVFSRAHDIHIATGLVASELRGAGGAASTAATAPKNLAEKLDAVSKSNPNLKSLFSLTDLCECDECRSIDGPAAYLVDVMQFIKNRMVVDTTVSPPIATKTAKDVLLARRPDLGDIDLTCDNAMVPLPYIDVVCELLEQAVAPDPGFAYAGAIVSGIAPAALVTALQPHALPFTAAAYVQDADATGNLYVRDTKVVCKLVPAGAPNTWTVRQLRQTFGSTAELAAAPAYVNDAAYQALRVSQIAFHLPFDLAHEESRAYFGQFAVARDSLMRALTVGGAPAPRDIAAEQLDISDAERALIGAPDPAHQATYWNTGAIDPATVFNVVDPFLTRTELQYADLQTLLSLTFINPDNKLFIQHLDSSCDTAQQVIANLDDAVLDRIHRFLRLRHRLGWDMTTLDRAIGAARLGNGLLTDDPLVVRLADLVRLQTRLLVPIEDLVIYYGSISTIKALDGTPSRYAQIFLNPSANGPIDPAFTIAAVQTNQGPPLPATQTHLSDVTATLAITLGAKPADIDLLVAARGANNVLSFDNLSALYSQLSLARAVGLSISDYLLLGTLTGIDPLSSPSAGLDFADASDAVKAASLKLVDLQFWLSFVASDVAVRGLSDAAVKAVLVSIQTALQAADLADRSPYDSTLTADENEVEIVAVVGRLPGVTATQLSSLQQIIDRTYADPHVTASAFIDQLLAAVVDTAPIKALQAALAALAPAQTTQIEAARLALIKEILDPVSAYLYQQARATLVPTSLATALHIDAALVTTLVGHAHLTGLTLLDLLGADALIDKINTPPVPPAITLPAFANQFAAVRLLQQIAQFSASLPMSNDDLQWLLDNAVALGWLQLDLLPYQPAMAPTTWAAWDSLQDALGLFGRYPPVANPADATQPFTLKSVFDLVVAGTTIVQLLDRLALVSGWDRTTLGDLDTRFGFSAIDLTQYREPSTYLQLETAIVLLRRLGLPVAGGVALIKPQLVAADALSLRKALKPNYATADWLGVLKQVYDPLRQQKRDALVAYLLAQNPTMLSSDDLFDYFMVDVEMCSCAPTSRIVSAHGTLQLFVQRCLLGVEPTAVADVAVDDGWDQWSWMSAYRVWQANREVFLYPENWIDPPLRDDKSEPYIAMENALAQSDLSTDAISDAAIGYLEALDDIAFLEVMSMYYEERTLTMHVFARTKGGDPHTYYYRQFVQEKTWTPWQKVDVDIKGDHLIAFIRNGRVNLAWPIFSEQANPDQDTSVPDSTPGTKVAKTQKAWQIQLAVSELSNGTWLPSKTSKESLSWTPWPGYYEQLPLRDYFRFIPLDLRGAGFSIACSFVDNGKRTSEDTPSNAAYFIGGFTLSGCKGYPEPYTRDSVNLLLLPRFLNTDVEDLRFVETSGNELAIETITLLKFVEILARTPNPFKVTYPQQISLIDYLILLFEIIVRANAPKAIASMSNEKPLAIPLGTFMPYFFEDSVHNYVVIPGYFSRRDEKQTAPIRRTFSDVLSIVEDIVALAKAYLLKFEEDPQHDLTTLLKQLVKDADFLNLVAELRVFVGLQYGIEFDNFYHPLVCSLRKTMYADGIGKMMDRATQLQTTALNFNTNYAPLPFVHKPYPIEDIDFTQSGSYASYNWELFFHLPLAVAVQLSQDQQFEQAMEWFHYIFNPTDASSEPVPQKYWQTKPFYQTTTADYVSQRIDTIMNGIAADPSGLSIDALRFAVQDWRGNPFEPFRVARSRTVAFQQAVLMKYIDNLIAWGDSLFTQDTMETVNQATQMYVLADKLLGPRPRIVPPLVTPPPETYNQLEAKIDLFGNALLDLENLIPDLGLLPHGGAELPPPPLTISSLYFCIPPNPNLDAYWDKVADRLFKIHNCQDINGVERILALFAPPIDPGALIAARAAGLSIADILAGLNAPLPLYRFTAQQTKATELVHIVIQLGSSMLQALEKRDAEALARLRSTEEVDLLNALLQVKLRHVDEAQVQIDVIQKSIDLTTAKSQYYHSRQYMNTGETVALVLTTAALVTEAIAMGLDIGAAITHMLPTFNIGIAGFGGSPSFSVSWGSENIAGAESGFAQVSRDVGSMLQTGSQMASTLGGYDRRQDEWRFQAQLADLEIVQLHRQLDAATIRLDITQKDVAAHQVQITNAKQTDQFLKTKFTNTELYEYMVGQLSAVFYRGYQLALDVAHKAERCFQFELGVDTTFIKYNYWDSLKKGLLSGDRLLSDVKQMDAAYMEQNKREYELTKHVSLAQLDPLALLQLKSGGACTFSIPEASFDLDHPGHYFRRLKTVSVTIPCVTGPYTSVSAKLSMVGNRYRKSTLGGGGYTESPGNDTRFAYSVTAIQSVATSQGENDSGLFDLNFHDERYLPFEYAGAISSWRLELPRGFPQFDYNAISDVVLKIRYTARDGGSGFRTTVETQLRAAMNAMVVDASNTGLYQGFDLRRQFPDEWYQLTQTGTTTLTITTDLIPFFSTLHAPSIDSVSWLARLTSDPASTSMGIDGTAFTLTAMDAYGKRCKGDSSTITFGTSFVLTAVNFAALKELSFAIHYTLGH